MSETPDYTPPVSKTPDKALESERIREATRADLKDLENEVEKTLEEKRMAKEMVYKESLRSYGFDPNNVRLEISATGATMTLPTKNAGDFEIGTADGYSWQLDGVQFKPSSYHPLNWYDENGIRMLDQVLEAVQTIDKAFYVLKNPNTVQLSSRDPNYEKTFEEDYLRVDPFSIADFGTLSIKRADYNGTSQKVARTGRHYEVGPLELTDPQEQKKLIDSLNARYTTGPKLK